MKSIRAWLVITDGTEIRVVKTNPEKKLYPNELAFELNIRVPQPPRIAGVIDIELPEAPPVDPSNVSVAEWMTWDSAQKRADEVRAELDD